MVCTLEIDPEVLPEGLREELRGKSTATIVDVLSPPTISRLFESDVD